MAAPDGLRYLSNVSPDLFTNPVAAGWAGHMVAGGGSDAHSLARVTEMDPAEAIEVHKWLMAIGQSVENFEIAQRQYVAWIQEAGYRRKLGKGAKQLTVLAADETVPEDELRQRARELAAIGVRAPVQTRTIGDIISVTTSRVPTDRPKSRFLTTGIDHWDEWEQLMLGQLCLDGAPTSHGKTMVGIVKALRSWLFNPGTVSAFFTIEETLADRETDDTTPLSSKIYSAITAIATIERLRVGLSECYIPPHIALAYEIRDHPVWGPREAAARAWLQERYEAGVVPNGLLTHHKTAPHIDDVRALVWEDAAVAKRMGGELRFFGLDYVQKLAGGSEKAFENSNWLGKRVEDLQGIAVDAKIHFWTAAQIGARTAAAIGTSVEEYGTNSLSLSDRMAESADSMFIWNRTARYAQGSAYTLKGGWEAVDYIAAKTSRLPRAPHTGGMKGKDQPKLAVMDTTRHDPSGLYGVFNVRDTNLISRIQLNDVLKEAGRA